MKKTSVLILSLFYTIVSFSQDKYWIEFNEQSQFTIDLGIKKVESLEVKIENKSVWLHAVSAYLTQQQKEEVEVLPEVAIV